MHRFVSNLTLVALLGHVFFGCCWHHGHGHAHDAANGVSLQFEAGRRATAAATTCRANESRCSHHSCNTSKRSGFAGCDCSQRAHGTTCTRSTTAGTKPNCDGYRGEPDHGNDLPCTTGTCQYVSVRPLRIATVSCVRLADTTVAATAVTTASTAARRPKNNSVANTSWATGHGVTLRVHLLLGILLI